jgi:acyl-CoA synthetase (AMP-forming)/AMP-acid ligase II
MMRRKRPVPIAAPGRSPWGNYGRVDASGYVYIAARRSDLIIRGGVNIYPAEVEAVLLLHPAVQDTCVFGRDDPEWGSCVHALVEIPAAVAGEGDYIGQLRHLLKQNLARYKHPQSLVITARIPRNAAGKVPQSALA